MGVIEKLVVPENQARRRSNRSNLARSTHPCLPKHLAYSPIQLFVRRPRGAEINRIAPRKVAVAQWRVARSPGLSKEQHGHTQCLAHDGQHRADFRAFGSHGQQEQAEPLPAIQGDEKVGSAGEHEQLMPHSPQPVQQSQIGRTLAAKKRKRRSVSRPNRTRLYGGR